MIVFRICALGDLIVTGPLLRALEHPFLVAHGEHLALARAAGWVRGGIDADAISLHGLYAPQLMPAQIPAPLRERLDIGTAALVIGRPGTGRDTLVGHLRSLGSARVAVADAVPPAGVHAIDALLAALALRPGSRTPRIRLPETWRRAGRERLVDLGVDPELPLLAVHVGAGGRQKRWPVEGWLRVLHGLAPSTQLVAIEGPADAEPTAALVQALPLPVLRGVPLVELAATLGHVSALLSHDSGVAHLAAALGCPTLCVFGATDPVRWAPRAVQVEIVRAPGGQLAELGSDEVLSAARRLLGLALTQSASSR